MFFLDKKNAQPINIAHFSFQSSLKIMFLGWIHLQPEDLCRYLVCGI
ncbi:MAG: hypothetical protein ACI9ES_000826 [Oceanospirillaceae bacterium]|jgi:hypothetical protein